MKAVVNIFYFLLFTFYFFVFTTLESGCAQIGAPTGGPKDSIAPKLLSAYPKQFTTNFSGNKITLNFDEYVDVKDVQSNVLVSPYPKTNPIVDFKLKTVTVKLKDTLQDNTTYSIDFGNSIQDNNEGNPYRNFTYVFSTGSHIDSLKLSGKIIDAETGKPDSTLVAMLYRNANDSSVRKRKPDYIARVNSEGNFMFSFLPSETFKIYALKDGDGSKTYNSATEAFAFADNDIIVKDTTTEINLYAYVEEKEVDKKKTQATPSTKNVEKKLRYKSSVSNANQDLLSDLELEFSRAIKTLDKSKVILTDTFNKTVPGVDVSIDSSQKKVILKTKWIGDAAYRIIVDKDAVTDSLDGRLSKTDTISFKTKGQSDYGSILLRFKNVNDSQHIVIQFVQDKNIVRSVHVSSAQWSEKLFPPGEYELRVLYDENNNGIWDPGNYKKMKQPEKAVTLDKKLNIKANWDNERDIQL